MRVVELEQYRPPSPFGSSVNITTGRITTDAGWDKLAGFKAEEDEDGKWTLTAYIRRTDECKVESGFPDLETLLNRVASIQGVDSKHIRVVKS